MPTGKNNEGDSMNKGDSVVFVRAVGGLNNPGIQNLVKRTFEYSYGDTVSLSDGNRQHLAPAALVFPNMEMAVKAVTMRALMRASIAESDAKQARQLANDWLRKLEDFD